MNMRQVVAIGLLAFSLAGCSLSTVIGNSAAEYNSMLAEYSDHVLLSTILRARDHAPINIANLSTITGSMTFQGGIGNSNIVTNLRGGMTANTISPTLQGTSAPTWNMAPLNTQGFTLNLIQPISPMYVVSKWRSGTDREFLLLLFMKSIEYRGTEVINNPDSPLDNADFHSVIQEMIHNDVKVKALTILEPIGFPYEPSSVPQRVSLTETDKETDKGPPDSKNVEATPAPKAASKKLDDHKTATKITKTVITGKGSETTTYNSTNQTASALLNGFQFLTGLNDAQYHVGNFRDEPVVPAGNDAASKKRAPLTGLQLYRQYLSQVVLCVDERKVFLRIPRFNNLPPGTGGRANFPTEGAAPPRGYAAAVVVAAAKKGGGGGGSSPSGGGGGGGTGNSTGGSQKGASAPSSSSPGGAQPAATASLQLNRVSAVLLPDECKPDQLVQSPTTEEEFPEDTKDFTHIEWRSIAELIQYLGAIVRHQDKPDVISWKPPDSPETHLLFKLTPASPSAAVQPWIAVGYRDTTYQVDDPADVIGKPKDHTLEALAMLNELIGIARISSDIPISQPLQIVP